MLGALLARTRCLAACVALHVLWKRLGLLAAGLPRGGRVSAPGARQRRRRALPLDLLGAALGAPLVRTAQPGRVRCPACDVEYLGLSGSWPAARRAPECTVPKP